MAQTLETVIAINARVGNGFSQVGATLTELGSMVNGASQQLINFGKESVTVYRDYEKSMTDAEVALSTTYGRGTKELAGVMSQLDVSATQWAASTIFHTNDVANAISEAAHAGWDLDQIMNGIPAAMQLAQAGGLDLSEAVNYIVKSTNAAGVGFEDLGQFIDLWSFAANSSASTIGEFGDAMLRMGSTMRFAGNTEELMTLIAVTANAGSTGQEAGTMIRNSMMRLIAPTDKAEKAMALLGATSTETSALLGDEALAAANARLAATGFSAFDEKGQMKNVLDIYRELYVALGDVAGGYENIDRNQDALSILSSIFPTRTITEALTLLRGASEGYDGLYEAMRGGDATGYGQYAAETMMETLDGKIETFESKVERLKQLVGEELSGQLETALGGIGDIVDKISEMDEGNFSALVAGLEVIAGAGPALMLAGGAFRLIGYALTPAGGIGLGLIALTAAAAAIKELEEADFAKAFGTAEIDSAAIQTYVQGLGTDFENAYTQVDNFRQAVDDSVTSYKTASETFTGDLLTNMLTGTTMTPEQITKLEGLGMDMYKAVQTGITNSTAASMSYWEMLFGGEGTAETDPQYQAIIDLTNQAYEDALGQATTISQGLREAMTSAFDDGTVSEEEYQEILEFVRAYNDAMARAASEAQSEQDYIAQQTLLHRAQTAGLDDIKTIAKEVQTERERVLKEAEDNYLTEKYGLEYRWDQAIANGTTINGETATEEGKAAALAAVDEKYNSHVLTQGEKYDDILYKLWDGQIQQSEYADAYSELGALADRVLNGEVTADSAVDLFKGKYGNNAYAGESDWGNNNTRTRLGELLARQIAGYGGYEGLQARIDDYTAQGDTASAEKLRRLYAMQQINDNFAQTGVMNYSGIVASIFGDDTIYSSSSGEYSFMQMQRDAFLASLDGAIPEYTADIAKRTLAAFSGENGQMDTYFAELGKTDSVGTVQGLDAAWGKMSNTARTEFYQMVEQLSQTYDFEKLLGESSSFMADEGNAYRDEYAAWQLLFGDASTHPEDYKIKVTPEVDPDAPVDIPPVKIPVEPKVEGDDSMSALQDQGVQVQVGADTTELSATIDAEDGQNLMEYISGDASNLSMTITDQDGKVLTEIVDGNTSSLAAAIATYNGRTITVNIRGNRLFAEGGRATTASTFGEAGPEWAIPEEHSERTAQLLDAARAASGFTWPDLLSRFGGLNANPQNVPTTFVYSPTIHAENADGVEQVLAEDKKRMDKWFEEKKMRDEVEVYP